MSKSRDLGEFPAAALDIDASGNLDVTGTVTADGLVVNGGIVEFSSNNQASGSVLNITNSFSGSGWDVNDLIGTIDFRADDPSATQPIRGSIQSVVEADGGGNFPNYTALSFSTASVNTLAERLRIDSAGNVGIGVVPEAWRANDFIGLQVGTGAAVYGRGSGDEDKSGLASNAYYDNANDRWQYIAAKTATNYYQVSGQHLFQVAPSGTADSAISWSEAMRIDSAGNLLVGTTDKNPSGNSVEGIALSAGSYGGFISAARSGGTVAQFARLTNDGTLVEFKKDSTTVGSISNDGALIRLSSGSSGGLFLANNGINIAGFVSGENLFRPASDNAIDLGRADRRWKDLYLSGVQYLDGVTTRMQTITGVGGAGIFNTIVANKAQTGLLYAIEHGTNNFLLYSITKESGTTAVSTYLIDRVGLYVSGTNSQGTIALSGHSVAGNVRMFATTITRD